MKHAAAIKFGGDLVAAVDCDYDSYLQLGTICPECKESVFLRVGSNRVSVKGKEYKVGPHWCHRKGTSVEQVASCESRVNGYTESDRERIATQSRGQRLKLLQRWFWRAWCNSNSHLVNMGCPDEDWLTDLSSKFSLDVLGDHLRFVIDETNKDFENHSWMQYREFPLEILRWSNPWISLCHDEIFDENNFDNRIKIAIEVLGFLLCKSSRPLLENAAMWVKQAMWGFERVSNGGEAFEEKDITEIEVAEAICAEAMLIPWAAEFQRLESESKARSQAA